jgi:hypothetical protein
MVNETMYNNYSSYLYELTNDVETRKINKINVLYENNECGIIMIYESINEIMLTIKAYEYDINQYNILSPKRLCVFDSKTVPKKGNKVSYNFTIALLFIIMINWCLLCCTCCCKKRR